MTEDQFRTAVMERFDVLERDMQAVKNDVQAVKNDVQAVDRKLEALSEHLGVGAERDNLSTVERRARGGGSAAAQPPMQAKSG